MRSVPSRVYLVQISVRISSPDAKSITSPAPGNHDYHVAGGADYFTYFNNPPQYYSFDLGSWHIVSLNGEIGIASGSTQETWFRNDLAAHTNKCTLVYWHEPRFSSGPHGGNPAVDAFDPDRGVPLEGYMGRFGL